MTALEKGMPLEGTINVPFADGKKGHLFTDKKLYSTVRGQRTLVGQERLPERRQDDDAR